MPSSQAGLTFLLTETGALSEARARFEQQAAEGFTSIPRSSAWMITLMHLAEVCVALGDAERAGLLHELLAPYRARNISAGIGIASGGPVARLLGMLSHVKGDWDESERHFEVAVDLCDRMGAEIWGAHSRRNYAAMLTARQADGDRERARQLLDHAVSNAERLGVDRIRR